MEHLAKGKFYGQTNETFFFDGITLTDTEYTHYKVDWHYHENPYFTFILQGNIIEGNKKEVFHCSAGTLLFHNWHEPHYNIKLTGFTRGFHIELEQKWINGFDVDLNNLQGSIHISNLGLKLLLYKIFKEVKINDSTAALSIQSLMLQTLTGMEHSQQVSLKNKPAWVLTIGDILHDQCSDKLSLNYLSNILELHPVHLSRDFAKYFQCNLGDYIRKLKIQKSLSYLSNRKRLLVDIAFECGFADQSHFIRCFKEMIGMSPLSPLTYRKILFA